MPSCWPKAASLVLPALLLAMALPAGGNHPQAASDGRSVAFTSVGGNEWWVQVRMGGPDGASATSVQAMDTGGAWVTLARQSWTADGTWWAKSFHVEPGHQVRLRATLPGGAVVESCWFAFPSGAERCAAPPGFAASFTEVSGNAWWVQARVTANEPLAGVDARVDCGATWKPLAKQDYGWSASFSVPDGSKVDFRARSTSGAHALSGGYVWPDATPTTGCAGAPAGARVEAESFAVRTTGGRVASASGSGGAAWNLWSNGHIEHTFPADGATPLRVYARGTPMDGVWPTMVVRVDGATVLTTPVATTSYKEYAAPAPAAGTHTVRVSFVNDASDAAEDRNLVVDLVRTSPPGPAPAADLKVAFLGDQGAGPGADAVLRLVLAEGADMVVHMGDFDYADDPAAWDARITGILGADFPYFAAVGNHDLGAWDGYQARLEERASRVGASCAGDLGVKSVCRHQGLHLALSGVGLLGTGHATYLRDQLAADNSMWSVCAWHVNQNAMQVGAKADEAGWGVYEECRKGGAIVATAHEHSYARTKTLVDTDAQAVDPAWKEPGKVRVAPGSTFVFHSGLGGHSVRDQVRCLPAAYPYGCSGEWASIYANQQGATHGALFCTFNPGGKVPHRADCHFEAVNGAVPDRFTVYSQMG